MVSSSMTENPLQSLVQDNSAVARSLAVATGDLQQSLVTLTVEAVLWRSSSTATEVSAPAGTTASFACVVLVDGEEVGRGVTFPLGPFCLVPRSPASNVALRFTSCPDADVNEPLSEEAVVQGYSAEVTMLVAMLTKQSAPRHTSQWLGLPSDGDTRLDMNQALLAAKNPEVPKACVTVCRPLKSQASELPSIPEGPQLLEEGTPREAEASTELFEGTASSPQPLQPHALPTPACGSGCWARSGAPLLWRFQPGDGLAIKIRSSTFIDAPWTGSTLQPGEVFAVCQERKGPDGVRFLKLADGRGWVFDMMPGVGRMCQRHQETQKAVLSSPAVEAPAVPGPRVCPEPSPLTVEEQQQVCWVRGPGGMRQKSASVSFGSTRLCSPKELPLGLQEKLCSNGQQLNLDAYRLGARKSQSVCFSSIRPDRLQGKEGASQEAPLGPKLDLRGGNQSASLPGARGRALCARGGSQSVSVPSSRARVGQQRGLSRVLNMEIPLGPKLDAAVRQASCKTPSKQRSLSATVQTACASERQPGGVQEETSLGPKLENPMCQVLPTFNQQGLSINTHCSSASETRLGEFQEEMSRHLQDQLTSAEVAKEQLQLELNTEVACVYAELGEALDTTSMLEGDGNEKPGAGPGGGVVGLDVLMCRLRLAQAALRESRQQNEELQAQTASALWESERRNEELQVKAAGAMKLSECWNEELQVQAADALREREDWSKEMQAQAADALQKSERHNKVLRANAANTIQESECRYEELQAQTAAALHESERRNEELQVQAADALWESERRNEELQAHSAGLLQESERRYEELQAQAVDALQENQRWNKELQAQAADALEESERRNEELQALFADALRESEHRNEDLQARVDSSLRESEHRSEELQAQAVSALQEKELRSEELQAHAADALQQSKQWNEALLAQEAEALRQSEHRNEELQAEVASALLERDSLRISEKHREIQLSQMKAELEDASCLEQQNDCLEDQLRDMSRRERQAQEQLSNMCNRLNDITKLQEELLKSHTELNAMRAREARSRYNGTELDGSKSLTRVLRTKEQDNLRCKEAQKIESFPQVNTELCQLHVQDRSISRCGAAGGS